MFVLLSVIAPTIAEITKNGHLLVQPIFAQLFQKPKSFQPYFPAIVDYALKFVGDLCIDLMTLVLPFPLL